MIVLSLRAIYLPLLSLLILECLGLHYNRSHQHATPAKNIALRAGLEEENQNSEDFGPTQTCQFS